jgi:hypothetical protein
MINRKFDQQDVMDKLRYERAALREVNKFLRKAIQEYPWQDKNRDTLKAILHDSVIPNLADLDRQIREISKRRADQLNDLLKK